MFNKLYAKKKRNLGKYNRQLVIRILRKNNVSHIILTRQRTRAKSRLHKLGYVDIRKPKDPNDFLIMAIHKKKFNDALCLGAKIHHSVLKFIIPR